MFLYRDPGDHDEVHSVTEGLNFGSVDHQRLNYDLTFLHGCTRRQNSHLPKTKNELLPWMLEETTWSCKMTEQTDNKEVNSSNCSGVTLRLK